MAGFFSQKRQKKELARCFLRKRIIRRDFKVNSTFISRQKIIIYIVTIFIFGLTVGLDARTANIKFLQADVVQNIFENTF